MKESFEIIEREAREHGVISFARFMELALYCPNYGYYETDKDRVGKAGDFFTSVSVGSLFGELLAFQFAEWMDELRPAESRVQIVEAGAHDGKLAQDILEWLSEWRRDIFDSIEYWIVEPSDRRRDWQRETLRAFGSKIQWCGRLSALANATGSEGVHGIIFSNELLDAMPVHRLIWNAADKRWTEWGVALRSGDLVWLEMPLERTDSISQRLLDELPRELHEILPNGFTTEISPAAEQWWREAACVLKRGILTTIDYGLEAEEFFAPERCNGTLRSYSNHYFGENLLANPGERDITAHVNFSVIQQTGESAGLKTTALVSQSKFLSDIMNQFVRSGGAFEGWTARRTRQLQTLIHPEHLGRSFKVLVQSR